MYAILKYVQIVDVQVVPEKKLNILKLLDVK